MSMNVWGMGALLVPMMAVAVWAEAPKPRLQSELNDDHVAGHDWWVYNDLEAARERARRENKPLFVTFRCVPCRDCAGFDAEVAQGSGDLDRLINNEFVAVRQVEMKGVDLAQFQFDYDLNWAAMFINADGTVYARYGTQSAEGADAYNSIIGLKRTMQRVLELHRAYPKNRAMLAGKRGPKPEVQWALELPGMENAATLEGLTTRKNCIHCHMIHDAQNRSLQHSGKFSIDALWRYPLPSNVGLEIERDHGTRVAAILDGAAADDSGIEVGEEIVTMNGQAITSIADMQWVLHHLPNAETSLAVVTSRTGEHRLPLQEGWKVVDPSWRGSMWSVSPILRTWTPEVDDATREKLGLSEETGAFEVRWINNSKPGGRAVLKSGIRKGDVIIEADGKPLPRSSARFHTEVKLRHKVGESLKLTVLRGGKRREFSVQLVE